jgi:methyltransferase (TIGR00027 family)
MKQNHASHTAEYVALFRALEFFRPSGIRLFEDPFAHGFLRPSLRVVVQLSRIPGLGRVVPWIIDRRWPGARGSAVARTRLIDDLLIKALQDGIEQVVILGAGYDCRAYRISGIERTLVYEVDHPATSAAKRESLRGMLDTLPQHVKFVEIDFNRQRLDEALAASRFDPSRPSLFIWEGVTNYLTAEAVDTTLQYISRAQEGSQLIFTYVHRAVLDNPAEFDGTKHLIQLLQEEDELWTFGLYPEELPSYLRARGYELIADLGSVEYRARYLAPDGAHMKGYEFYRIALARVSKRSL